MIDSISYSLILSVRAEEELQRLWQWYEDREVALGDKLVTKIRAKRVLIQHNPEYYAPKNLNYREVKVPSFPVQIIFRINKRKKRVTITSFFHTSQNTTRKYRG